MSAAIIIPTRQRWWLGQQFAAWRLRRLRRELAGMEQYTAQVERALRECRYREQQLRVRLALLEP